MLILAKVFRTARSKLWYVVIAAVFATLYEVTALNGPNVCMVKQKYNITKRVKYRAPLSVRTYEWCFSMPPRCSKWNTEMRDLTRLETEERTAEVAICCPGYKMKDVSCVPVCPNGRTGPGCSDACPTNKWGPNCVNECRPCDHGSCSPITGDCRCRDGWQGESCEISMPPITISTLKIEALTTTPTTKTTAILTTTPAVTSTSFTTVETKPTYKKKTTEITTKTTSTTTFIGTMKILTTEAPENTTEFTTTLSSLNKTPITPTEINTNPTVITTATEPTRNVYTSIYNRTLIPLIVDEPNVTTVRSKISSTSAEQILKLTITTQTSVNITEKNDEPELMRSNINIDRSKNNIFKGISMTITEYGTPTSTTARAKFVTAPASNTEEYHSIQASIVKETPISIPFTTIEVRKTETIRNTEATMKIPTTIKFKPKEIWIKPALKGETAETKKVIYDATKYRTPTNKDFTVNTTPKTIIVSIIPTSVSYSTFKKIALTTASYLAQKNNKTLKNNNKSTEAYLKPTPFGSTTTKFGLQLSTALNASATVTLNEANTTRATKILTTKPPLNPERIDFNKTLVTNTNTTGKSILNISMTNFSNFSTKTTSSADFKLKTKRMTLINDSPSTTPIIKTDLPHKHYITAKHRHLTKSATNKSKDDKIEPQPKKDNHKILTKINKVTTEDPLDEEVFHILTEPEHITAVMGEKERGRTSMDLVSVVSIAGGIMMAVITVAVIIVMVERHKRPRYENVRKINDIHMQVMIDNNDPPPPYVRSIFHTPLPDPPMSENKCHYQPISTLDRNLKQFMRPVVVQTISPIMMENFRGILECHYDHLPRRSHGFASIEPCCSLAPSVSSGSGLRCNHGEVTDCTIEALKCEARMDVIDTTTSEPLYAEIPCWRPPSEHATEIINLNGEAVTEL